MTHADIKKWHSFTYMSWALYRYWCAGPTIPKDMSCFYEVKIVSAAESNGDLFFGFGSPEQGQIGDTEAVTGIYYRAGQSTPEITPSHTKLPASARAKRGDVIRCELDASASMVTFFLNGERVGEERLSESHCAGELAPYVAVYYADSKVLLQDAGLAIHASCSVLLCVPPN